MFSFELWLEGDCLHWEDNLDTEEEAIEEATEYAKGLLEDWQDDDYTLEDFEIKTFED